MSKLLLKLSGLIINGIDLTLEGEYGASVYSKRNATKVSSIRLKDLIEKEKIIDMLKIDIEEAEYNVLLDCKDSLSNVENIFIEYHSFANSNQNYPRSYLYSE